MTKVALASGSFIVGVCVASLGLLLIHMSTRVQASQGVVMSGIQASGASFCAREPEVFPLAIRLEGSTLTNEVQPLDGIDCEKCGIKAGVLTYAGGAFRCNECAILSTSPQIQLKGAALNTFNMLRFIGVVPSPPAPKPMQPPKRPSMIALNAITSKPISWVSLEGLK